MNALQFAEYLKSINACDPACKWQEGKDLETVWNTCERGDWMIWLLVNSENEVTDRELRLIAVKCARQVQHLMKDERSINALDVAERFANGEATQEELNAAWDAARAAGDAAWAAAWAAAWEAAWEAAGDAAGDAAWDAARAKQAEIVREFVPMIKIK